MPEVTCSCRNGENLCLLRHTRLLERLQLQSKLAIHMPDLGCCKIHARTYRRCPWHARLQVCDCNGFQRQSESHLYIPSQGTARAHAVHGMDVRLVWHACRLSLIYESAHDSGIDTGPFIVTMHTSASKGIMHPQGGYAAGPEQSEVQRAF